MIILEISLHIEDQHLALLVEDVLGLESGAVSVAESASIQVNSSFNQELVTTTGSTVLPSSNSLIRWA